MMNLALKPEVERVIKRRVQSGEFASAEDVIEAAVEALQHESANHFVQAPEPSYPQAGPLGEERGAVVQIGTANSPGESSPGATVGSQLPLFGADVQPWNVKPQPKLDEERLQERKELLAALAAVSDSRLGSMELRVASLLQHYPETRDSDTALAIRYWRTYQPDVLEKWDRLDLDILYDLDRIETISRIRRHIQNVLLLFSASGFTRHTRGEMQMEFNQYLAAQTSDAPEIRFYLDETGNDPNKPYLGVAGICVLEWRQYEKHWASISKWRAERGWPETIRFAQTGTVLQPRATALLQQLQTRRSGLLFLGYAMSSRGRTYEAMLSLFIQLVVDALHRADDLGCLTQQRALSFVKEAEEGFDRLHLQTLRKYLEEQIAREFPRQIFVRDVQSIPKGREVFLECADLIAGAMQRRALHSANHPKDDLAETVFNVTGFEDIRTTSAIYKAHL
jgi:hypothetical protein